MSLSCLSYGWAKQSSDFPGSGFLDPNRRLSHRADLTVPGIWGQCYILTFLHPPRKHICFRNCSFFTNATLGSNRQKSRHKWPARDNHCLHLLQALSSTDKTFSGGVYPDTHEHLRVSPRSTCPQSAYLALLPAAALPLLNLQ